MKPAKSCKAKIGVEWSVSKICWWEALRAPELRDNPWVFRCSEQIPEEPVRMEERKVWFGSNAFDWIRNCGVQGELYRCILGQESCVSKAVSSCSSTNFIRRSDELVTVFTGLGVQLK